MLRFMTSSLIARHNQAPSSSWGDDPTRKLQRLIVVVTCDDPADEVEAYGIDPDSVDPDTDYPLYAARFPRRQLGAFLQLIIEGQDLPAPRDLPASAPINGPHAWTVDVSNPQPPTTGPKAKLVLAHAAAQLIDERFKEYSDLLTPLPEPTPASLIPAIDDKTDVPKGDAEHLIREFARPRAAANDADSAPVNAAARRASRRMTGRRT